MDTPPSSENTVVGDGGGVRSLSSIGSRGSSVLSSSSLSSDRDISGNNNNKSGDAGGAIRLCRSTAKLRRTGTAGDGDSVDNGRGYVNGDYGTGKIADLELPSACYAMTYNNCACTTQQRASRPLLLAVGMRDGWLAFYEASASSSGERNVLSSSYSLVHRLQIPSCYRSFSNASSEEGDSTANKSNNMISTLKWCCVPVKAYHRGDTRPGPSKCSTGCISLLAVGTLRGSVLIYRVDADILESQGPTLVHQFRVDVDQSVHGGDDSSGKAVGQQQTKTMAEIRSMDMALFGQLNPSVVLACATKAGQVAFASLACADCCSCNDETGGLVLEPVVLGRRENCNADDTVEVWSSNPSSSLPRRHSGDAVLGLALHSRSGLVAWSTKSGRVVVHRLRRNANMAVTLDDRKRPVWDSSSSSTVETNGPVRCVVFSKSGDQLVFGGYDKMVVVVDTRIWAVSRELRLQGTVSNIALCSTEFVSRNNIILSHIIAYVPGD